MANKAQAECSEVLARAAQIRSQHPCTGGGYEKAVRQLRDALGML